MELKALRLAMSAAGYKYFNGVVHGEDGTICVGFSTDPRGKDDSLTLTIQGHSNDLVSNHYTKGEHLWVKEHKDISDSEVFGLIEKYKQA